MIIVTWDNRANFGGYYDTLMLREKQKWLIWLYILINNTLHKRKMSRSRSLLFIGSFLMGLFYSCSFLSTESKDHIEFNNIDSIQLVIKEMDTLMHKLPLPSDYKLKHFNIRKDGTLVINGIIINTIDQLNLNDFYEHNVFSVLSKLEMEKFYHNILYLNKNEITDAYQGECFWQFDYFYKSNSMHDSPSHRKLIYVYNQSDTASTFFKYFYQILDEEKGLVLYKSIIHTKEIFDPPSYPKLQNPYQGGE